MHALHALIDKAMKKQFIASFIIGAICRYFFLKVYGYLAAVLLTHRIESYFIGLFSIPWKKTAFYFLNFMEGTVVAFAIILVPAIIYGYYTKGPKKFFLLCSVFSYLGLIFCDALVYASMGDIGLMFYIYFPVWHGILTITIWIGLFFGVYSLGNMLQTKKENNV